MTWIDITIIIVIGLGTYVGFKVGLIRAVLSAIACVLGLFLAGQLSDDIGSFLSESISSDTVITVISYIVIVVVCLLASSIATKIIKPILTALTAGLSNLADKVGTIITAEYLREIRDSHNFHHNTWNATLSCTRIHSAGF